MYLGDLKHSSFNSTERTLHRGNLRDLRSAWQFDTDGPLAAGATIVDGVAYFGSWAGSFYAVDAQSGRQLWSAFVGISPAPDVSCSPALGVSSQAVVKGDTVYVGGGDSAVYALDRYSGELRWRLQLADPDTGSYLWASLIISGNALYVGIASLGDCPLVRGALVRIELEHPEAPLFRFLAPEGELGAGIWSTPAIDELNNRIYVTTGTGEQNPEEGLWGGAVLALDATSLEIQASFLLPTNSSDHDIEWGSSPTLFEDVNGTPLVAAAGKDGVLYALRASDLSLVWQKTIGIWCGCPQCGCGSLSTPAFDGEVLYAAGGGTDPQDYYNGTVYALNPATGRTIWRTPVPGVVIAPLTIANNLVFAGTLTGLEILDAFEGTKLWSEPFPGTFYSQPVVSNGTIFCTYANGYFGAWRVPQ